MKRIPAIDGFRAIAILIVMAFHYINNQLIHTKTSIGHILYQLTGFGWVGVDLFFLISGFLIGSILLSYKRTAQFYKTFYIRRFLRIIPVYYLLICLFILITNISWFKGDVFLTGNNVIPTWSYFAMLHNFYMAAMESMGNKAMSVTWSIGIEEQFYLLFPVLLLLIKEKWAPFLLGIFIVSANICRSFYTNWIPAYVLLPCRMDAISFGILLAWLNKNYNIQDFVQKYKAAIFASAGSIMLLCAFLFFKFNDIGLTRNSLIAFLFSCFIILALGLPGSKYARFLGNGFFEWIAKLSYSLYLFHYMILAIARNIGSQFGDIRETVSGVSITAAALSVCILFSVILYRYFEQPIIKMGKKHSYGS